MKQIISKTILILTAAAALSTPSCDDFLTLNPTGSIVADNAISDAKTARAAIIGVYSQLRAVNFGGSSIHILGTMPGDNVRFGGTLTQYTQLDGNAYPTNNVVTVAVYSGLYQLINRANWIIADISKVNDPQLPQSEKDQILGEAYFARALGYFELARGWGGVQIQTSPTTDLSAITGIKRSTLAETFAQSVSDLAEAEKLLPAGSDRTRAQQAAAQALRARVHLYARQWDDAERYATLVIDNTQYELVKPYSAFFTSPFLSRESVLEISSSANAQNTSWYGWYSNLRKGSYEYQPTEEIIQLLSDPDIAGGRSELIETDEAGKAYNAQFRATGLDPIYLIRIAELYLIRAEARAKKSSPDLTGAIADLNAIRRRAEIADYAGAQDAVSVIQAIEDERRVEFAFEPHRWYDLVRTERAGEVLDVTNRNFWIFPLPEADVLSDPDLDGQNNPGY